MKNEDELITCPVCKGTDLSVLGMKCRICNGTGKIENFLLKYKRENNQKMNINIVRKGISPITQEARKCPVCETYAQHYILEDKWEPPYLKCQQAIIDRDYYVQKYPTFTCDKCKTIWQYLGEKKEEKE